MTTDHTPPAERTALREQIAHVIATDDGHPWDTLCADTQQHYRDNADAVLAVLPAPADRAAILREAADQYAKLTDQNEAYDREQGELDEEARLRHEVVRDVVTGLRRLADETQPTPCSCGVLRAGPGRHLPECPNRPAQTTARDLTDTERTMLTYALDQAQEHIWSRDGFTDAEQAAVDSLRRLTAEPRQDGAPS